MMLKPSKRMEKNKIMTNIKRYGIQISLPKHYLYISHIDDDDNIQFTTNKNKAMMMSEDEARLIQARFYTFHFEVIGLEIIKE